MPTRGRRITLIAGLAAVATSTAAGIASGTGDAAPGRGRCDYGITLALLGRTAEAESVFVSLLDEIPGDPRALNNLGNVRFLSGEPDVAAAFYELAAAGDTLDPGILLNRAAALMVLGDESGANAEARRAIGRAGGVAAAAGILGLAPGGGSGKPAKAAGGAVVSEEEIQALLLHALDNVPVDSSASPDSAGTDTLKADSPDTTATETGEHGHAHPSPEPLRAWRTAGPRAAGPRTVPGTLYLYWKR